MRSTWSVPDLGRKIGWSVGWKGHAKTSMKSDRDGEFVGKASRAFYRLGFVTRRMLIVETFAASISQSAQRAERLYCRKQWHMACHSTFPLCLCISFGFPPYLHNFSSCQNFSHRCIGLHVSLSGWVSRSI